MVSVIVCMRGRFDARMRFSAGSGERAPCAGILAHMVKDMAFIAYSVRDLPAATAFYRDVLGLQPAESFGDHWMEFSVGSTTFGIGNGESLGYPPGQSTGASFEVDDIAAMRERLAKHGVTVSDVKDFPSCSACFASDPEGNKFALHQKHA